jgi:glutaredoxin
LLKSKGYTVEVRKLDIAGPWTKKHLLELVPGARSVPQIFVGSYYVGGLNELVKYFKEGQ